VAVSSKPPKLAKDFWRSFHKNAFFIVLLIEIVATAIIAGGLYMLGIFTSNQMVFWAVLASSLILNSIGALIIYKYTSKPAKDLLAAIIHVSGEPTVTTPPNPNEKRYEKNGFKDVLQTVYELASKETATPSVAVTTTNTPAVAPTSPESVLKTALDETIAGFVVLGHDRSVTFANKAAPTKVSPEGKTTLDVMFPTDNTLEAWLDECEKSAVHTEHSWTRIADKLPDEEGRRFFDIFASYDKGAASETVITLIDRTNLYAVGEQELDFIAFAAHELRGPITVIRGYLDVLEDELAPVLQDDQHELFRRLTVSANRLSGYINNILNTSRYDRRHLKVHLAESSVAEVYDMIKDDMDLRASAQNRLLSVTIPPDLPTIPADPTSLSEVFGNLIDNAIKYSNEGGAIAVIAEKKGDTVEVSIQDHGIGMPGNVVSNLFQKFYRSHRSRETVAGTGIGLYISKAIVESHGGTISVRSEEGQGSTFVVSLPTYATVADKLKAGDNSNEGMIDHGDGWIKNHSMYRS
jgi:signal transduction histidine kinase